MYEKIPAKRCIYKGIVFHSKLEARWAIIFDTLGLDWVYEPGIYKREWGDELIEYKPDFYFPKYRIYAEVKPTDEALKKDGYKIAQCVDWAGPLSDGILILGAIPDSREMAYKIPCFSFLYYRKACVLDYVALTPTGILKAFEDVDCCDGVNGVPNETSVTPRWIRCGDLKLISISTKAFDSGKYTGNKITELPS